MRPHRPPWKRWQRLLVRAGKLVTDHPAGEQLLEEAKGEAGLDEYEVRYWHSWYRHITLSMVAHTWLTLVRHTEREKKAATRLADLQCGRTAAFAHPQGGL